MATNHNFRVKNGLEVAGTEIVNSSGVLQLASGLTSSTQNAGTNNTTLATTAFVTAAITAIGNGKIDWTTDQGSTNIHAGNYINTTYSVGDGGLTTNDFTNADHSKLNAIEASATADQTDAEIRAAVEAATDSNVFTNADHTKLNAIEASATADQTDAEIRTAVEAATDSNVFTDADHSKLNAIEASATADQTGAQIKALYEAESNAYTDTKNSKLAGIEASATADQSNAEIRAAVEAATDSNVFTDTDHSKLNAIEASATADQTNAEIRTAVEAASDSNVFTDADHSKLNAIEASADVTDTANVVAALSAGTGVAISGGGAISVTAVALTTVQTASSQSAHLALTAQEGDIVVRSDENKTYCHNGGSAGNMNDYTLLATPTDAVLSVNGNTGAVSAAQIAAAVEAASNSNTFTDADHSKLNAIEASATADQTNAEIRTAVEAASDSNVFTDADHTKLNAIEASADVTDTANVTAAGALMDSEVTNLAQVKAFDSTDYATAAQGTTAGAALPKAGGTMTGGLSGTTATFSGEITANGGIALGDSDKATFGASDDLQIYHDGSNSYVKDAGTGTLNLQGATQVLIGSATTGEVGLQFVENSGVYLRHNNVNKMVTSATGISVVGTVSASALASTGAITSAAKNVGTQTVTATAPSSATGFPNGHVWYVV